MSVTPWHYYYASVPRIIVIWLRTVVHFVHFVHFGLGFSLGKVAGASGKGSYPKKNLVLGVCFFFGIVRFWISCGFGMEKNSMSTKISR